MISASAITEQAMRGQIGQPAACMMESTGEWAGQRGAAWRGIMAPGPAASSLRAGLLVRPHAMSTEAVDNVGGNPPRRARKPARHLGPAAAAAKSGAGFFLQIKHLHECVETVTRPSLAQPLSGAAVEFRTRVDPRFSRD
jgi:hypothetical protein